MTRFQADTDPCAEPIGRQSEVNVILARVRQAGLGRPGVLMLSGNAGVGKSALLRLVAVALGDDVTVLATTGREGDQDFAVARRLFGAAADDVLDAEPDLHRRRRLLCDLATAMTADRPLVMVVDDAQWCDTATARSLGFLARHAGSMPIYVVLAFAGVRRAAVEARFAELTSALDTTTLELGPVGEAEVAELVARGFGVLPHHDFVRACLEVSGGVPAATLRMLDRFRAGGGRPDVQGAAQLRAGTAGEPVEHWISWLGEQSETVRRYTAAVAVVGCATPTATGALFELSAGTAQAARQALRSTGVLDEDDRFRSEALRDRVLDNLGHDERCRLRARAARLLSDEGRPHRECADLLMTLPALTDPWMFCALREAARDHATENDLAIGYLRRVLDAVPGHVETRLELANVLSESDPKAALRVLAGVLDDVTDPATRAPAAVRYGNAALWCARAREAFPVLVSALRALPATADPEWRAQIEHVLLAVGYHDRATVGQALIHARDIAVPKATSTASRRLLQQLARHEMLIGGSVDRALDLTRLAMSAPGGGHDWWDLFAAMTLHMCGEHADAVAVADRVLDSTADRDDQVHRALVLAVRSALSLSVGDLTGAETDATAAFAIIPAGIWVRTVLASVLVRRGEYGRFDELLARPGEVRDPVEHGWAMVATAHRLWHSQHREAAVDVLLRCGSELDAAGVRNPVVVTWWVDAVAWLVELGRLGEARELAERGAEGARRWDTAASRGCARLAEGLITRCPHTLAKAVAELDAANHWLSQVQALTALGCALLDNGNEKAARKSLRDAVDLAVRCGDIVAADTARATLLNAGGRMSELCGSPLAALTGGEHRVALLAARGCTNREIAGTLFITVRTVESHLSNAYRKLGVRTRAELAARLESVAL